MATRVYIGVGSNLDTPIKQVTAAFQLLNDIDKTRVLATSPLYRSAPMANMAQADYINAAVSLETQLTALALLDELQTIESQQGRDHTAERWASRILDLDLLLFGLEQITNERLTVPHYGLHQRAFVLLPLNDLDATLDIPGKGSLKKLLTQCDTSNIELVNE